MTGYNLLFTYGPDFTFILSSCYASADSGKAVRIVGNEENFCVC